MPSAARVPGGPGRHSSEARVPLWVRIVGIGAVLFIALVAALHLSGRGMGGHGMGEHGARGGAER